MKNTRYPGLLLVMIVLLISACGNDDDDTDDAGNGDAATPTTAAVGSENTPEATQDDDDDQEDQEDQEDQDDGGTTATTGTDDDDADDDQGTPQSTPPGSPTEVTGGGVGDDIYPVGDAGEVEMLREGDDLTVVEARPNDGWTHRIDDDDDDEVEVIFNQNSTEIEFEAEVDDGRLEIKVCDERLEPEGDVYTVDDAGEVEVRLDGDDLVLVQVRPADGWSLDMDEEDDDELEVTFRGGERVLTFNLEVDDDDDGRVEAKTCSKEVR